MSINSNKNNGIIYKGFLIPYFTLTKQDSGDRIGGYAIKKTIANSRIDRDRINSYMKTIDANPNMTTKKYRAKVKTIMRKFIDKVATQTNDKRRSEIFNVIYNDFKEDYETRKFAIAWSSQNPSLKSDSEANLRNHQSQADEGGKTIQTQQQLDVSKKKGDVAKAIMGGATNLGQQTPEQQKDEAQKIDQILGDLKKDMTDQEYRAYVNANAKNWVDAEGRQRLSKMVDDITRQKEAIHEKAYTTMLAKQQSLIDSANKRTEEVKAQLGGEIREATFNDIQGIVRTIIANADPTHVDGNPTLDDLVGLVGRDGKLQRRPTAEELRQIVMIHNRIGGKHISPLPSLGYKLDESDPQLKRIKRQVRRQQEEHKTQTDAYILQIQSQETEIRQELESEHQKLLRDAVSAQDEAQDKLQTEIAIIQSLKKEQDDFKRKQRYEQQIREQELEEQTIFAKELEAERANMSLHIAQLNNEILRLDQENKGLEQSLKDERVEQYQNLQEKEEELAELRLQQQDQTDNVSLDVKKGTGAVIDATGSSGLGSGADANTQQATNLRGGGRAKPQPVATPNPTASVSSVSQGAISLSASYFNKLRQNRLIRGQRVIEGINDQHYKDDRRDELKKDHTNWINNKGVPMGLNLPYNVREMGQLENSSYAENQQQSQSALDADTKAKEEADYDTKTDALADVSQFGYDSQVSKYAKQQGRDFTYTMSMVAKSKNAPSQDATERARGKDLLLKEWGHTIGIKKAKGNSYEECLEIYTIVFLAEDLYRMERNWKKSIIKFLPYLENLSHQANVGNQLGMITASQTPMTMAQANALIAQRQPPPAPQRGGTVRGRSRPASVFRGGTQSRSVSPTNADARSIYDGAGYSSADADGGFATVESEEDEQKGGGGFFGGIFGGGTRRRLTGLGREVNYSRSADNTIVGQNNYSGTGIASARLPHMPSGIQSVRQIKAQLPRPPIKTSKKDGRPKMNVEKTKFKMRASRINPNLMFVNLDKQNPNLTQDLPIFKPRLNNKQINRIKF